MSHSAQGSTTIRRGGQFKNRPNFDRHFIEGDPETANRHTKGPATSAVIRETKPHGNAPTCPREGPQPERRMPARTGENGTHRDPHVLPAGMQDGETALENSIASFLKMRDIGLPYEPEILRLGVPPRERKVWIQTKTWMCMFITAFFAVARKQLKGSSICA